MVERIPEHIITKIRELISLGLSDTEIGSKLTKTRSSVCKLRKKYNIPSQRQRGSSSGKNNNHWGGGKYITVRGYVYIYSPDHPNRNRRNYVYEHRLIVEKHLGRYLTKEEIVHHINGDKSDNRIENLDVTTNVEHARLHMVRRQ